MSKRAENARTILISMGEPAGIGPEIAVKAYGALGGKIGDRNLRLVGDAEIFRAAGATCGVSADALNHAIIDLGRAGPVTPGQPNPSTASAVTGAIAQSVAMLRQNEAAALVTAPIHKAVLTGAGFGFPGHTEYLASLTGKKEAVMMLASRGLAPPLRVVPLTIHIALRDVFARVNAPRIIATAKTICAGLKADFGIARPRLAIAGLNPHAGEDATMGLEDRDHIQPAVAQLLAEGYAVSGPLSADTLFHDDARKTYDAVLCMYHDQALIPIKTLAFWTGVNVTLGLPIVRTSPDHGTALGLAGRGIANAASMIAAIETASEIADRRGL